MKGSSLIAFKENEKWGYKNNMGKIVIDSSFDFVPSDFKFTTEVLVETDGNGKNIYYLYDRSGNRLFSFNDLVEEEIFGVFRYQESDMFLIDVYDLSGNELTGMVDENGKVIIPPTFDSIQAVGEGLFKVYYTNPNEKPDDTGEIVMNKYGIYDCTGKEIFSPKFIEVGDFDRRIAIAEFEEYSVLINSKGKLIDGTESKSIDKVSRLHYILRKKNTDQLFIRPDDFGGIYEYLDYANSDNIYFIAGKNGKDVLVDFYMKELGEYDALLDDTDLLLAAQNGKWGIIDFRNQVIANFTYDHIDFFDEKSYVVLTNGKYGLIDRQGNPITPFTYEDDEILFEEFRVPNRKRNLRGV